MKNIDLDQHKIDSFCERWQVEELSIFGSAVGADFRPDSDVDVLVSFKKDVRRTLLDLSAMQEELKVIFGREVDLLTRPGLERSENHLRRKNILAQALVIYGPG